MIQLYPYNNIHIRVISGLNKKISDIDDHTYLRVYEDILCYIDSIRISNIVLKEKHQNKYYYERN